MPLRDPRPLANALVAVLSVAALAQAVRVVLRALAFRDASITYDFIMDPSLQPGAASLDLGSASTVRVFGEGLTLVLLVPLQVTVAVLWLLWQGRIRRNAKLLPAADPAAVARRIRALAAAAVAAVTAEALLYTAGFAGDADPIWTLRLVGLELVLDLAVLALMAAVASTTFAWTREQDQFVRHRV